MLASVSHGALARATSVLASDRKAILKTGISLRVLSHGGSNAIAVAPWRSADHDALLWGAPQEGFGTPSVDWEVYLHAPGYDAGGMAITGEPFLLIGRNAYTAWTTTSEETVDQRIYVDTGVDFSASPPTYVFNGKRIPMTAIKERIDIAGAAPQDFTVYRTNDGPVFSTDPADGVAFSIRFASWNRETGSLAGFSQLGGDSNLRELRHSMSLITTLHNFLYADSKGNFSDPSLASLGNYGGLGGMGTYNFLYHLLARTHGVQPCGTLCYTGSYFAGHRDRLLVESLNDAITILSSTGTQLGQDVPEFGTADISGWGYEPARDLDWDILDPLAQGVTTTCGTSASQNRSTFMMAADAGRHTVAGRDDLPPGESGFISAAGVPSPHLCDQVSLFDQFRYKAMPPT